MYMRRTSRAAGFTGFELLIVIALVGLLAWLVIIRFGNLAVIARDTERRLDLNILATELEGFQHDLGYYPPNFEVLTIFPQVDESGQTRLSPDTVALIDPDGNLSLVSPSASTNLPDTGYGPDRPDGAQYTYAPYNCSLAETNPETEAVVDPAATEGEDETATDDIPDADENIVFDQCQQYVLYGWLESGQVYFKVSRTEPTPADDNGN